MKIKKYIPGFFLCFMAMNAFSQDKMPGFSDGVNIRYTIMDTTIKSLSKFSIGIEGVYYWDLTARLQGEYFDYKNNFRLSAFYGIDGVWGLNGVFYFIKGSRMKPGKMVVKYSENGQASYNYAVKQNIEWVRYVGIHAGVSERELSDATEPWWEYYRLGTQNNTAAVSHFDSATGNTVTTYNNYVVSGPIPTFNELSVGPQLAWVSGYRVLANGLNSVAGKPQIVSRKIVKTAGLDVLYYTSKPVLNATYDSLSALASRGANQGNTPPSTNFSTIGARLYYKVQYTITNSDKSEFGLNEEISLEDNIAGFGFFMGVGLYYGL
ncbi:MAG: hypothetical protein ACLQQ4_00225 [Bacteroidia bacterium]